MKSPPTTNEMQGCYEKAIHEAISKGILVDYLNRKGTEVMNMFVGEYDYDLDMKVKYEEAYEEAYEKAYEKASLKKAAEDARNFYENGVSIEIIAKSMHMTEEQVREIVNEPVTVQD